MKNKWQKASQMQTRKKRNCKAAIIALILTPALTCCTSTRKRSGDVPYVKVPDPIQKDGTSAVILDAETDRVSMPMWYWRKIVNYIIDTQAALKIAGAEKQK
nr:MAG TPA: hypothetical protein [Caudoviricetes sp.]